MEAQPFDAQWPIGYSTDAPPFEFFGISLLDFSQASVETSAFNQEFHPIGMPHGSSFICDENGDLLLMTNGCKVFDRELQIVAGTDTLSPGITFDTHCEQYGSYPAGQTSLLLPEMSNDSVFYIVHKDSELSDILLAKISRNLYLSQIARKADGSFYLKDSRLLLNMEMIHGKLTACINLDGDKWWTWTADYHSNKIYKYLIGGEEVVEGPFIQEIGDKLSDKINSGIGQVTFSPNTELLGMLTTDHEILLYDFNNSTGELSNYRTIEKFTENDTGYGRGLAFSFDSKLLYLTTVQNLYQIDLSDFSWQHLAFHESYDEHGWPVTIGKMMLGPDCRIYIAPGATTFYMHVIHQPNQKGDGCQFEARALRSPTKINHAFPNLPMYRFDGACDSSIVFPVTTAVEPFDPAKEWVKIFPNPADDRLSVQIAGPLTTSENLYITDLAGRKMKLIETPIGPSTIEVDVGEMPPGLYFLFFENGLAPPAKFVIEP